MLRTHWHILTYRAHRVHPIHMGTADAPSATAYIVHKSGGVPEPFERCLITVVCQDAITHGSSHRRGAEGVDVVAVNVGAA